MPGVSDAGPPLQLLPDQRVSESVLVHGREFADGKDAIQISGRPGLTPDSIASRSPGNVIHCTGFSTGAAPVSGPYPKRIRGSPSR